jgi:hypothetical protein
MNMRLLVPSPFPSGVGACVDAGLSCSLTLVTSYSPLATVEPSVTAARGLRLANDWPRDNTRMTRRRTETASFCQLWRNSSALAPANVRWSGDIPIHGGGDAAGSLVIGLLFVFGGTMVACYVYRRATRVWWPRYEQRRARAFGG